MATQDDIRRRKDAARKRDQRAKAKADAQNREAAIAAGHGVADAVIESAVADKNLTVLTGIRDNDKNLPSDRIRAAVEAAKIEAVVTVEDPYAGLKALKDALMAVPEGDRLEAIDHMLASTDGDVVTLTIKEES